MLLWPPVLPRPGIHPVEPSSDSSARDARIHADSCAAPPFDPQGETLRAHWGWRARCGRQVQELLVASNSARERPRPAAELDEGAGSRRAKD